MDSIGKLIFVVMVAGVAALLIYRFAMWARVKAKGIEADAEVTGVREKESTDSDGSPTISAFYQVRYRTQTGEFVEAELKFITQNRQKLAAGDRIKVKYLPERPDYPVMTEKL
ncbi:MAG: DUF3592 domain-containing protein [Oscillibacter sp.]|nr:DUF3592 domain-containing protein [Oscillibacter sp.]